MFFVLCEIIFVFPFLREISGMLSASVMNA